MALVDGWMDGQMRYRVNRGSGGIYVMLNAASRATYQLLAIWSLAFLSCIVEYSIYARPLYHFATAQDIRKLGSPRCR